MRTQRWMSIVWPAFLVAGLLEMLVFAFVDPNDLQWAMQPLSLSREAIYTLTFFAFWLIATAGGILTWTLSLSPKQMNLKGS